jgi:hypothetical protein
MHRALGDFAGGEGYIDLSFREPQRWATMATDNSRVAGTAVSGTAVLLGDDDHGPVLLFLALEPNVAPPDAPAHGHASDTWRMSLRGVLPMGPDSYAPGEFRFQQGWKPYASDNYAHGPEGGWTALLFGDRRGMRVRHVHHEGPAITPTDRALAAWLGIEGDLVADDPSVAPGPSSLVTTLDDQRTGARLNGSFADADDWVPFEWGTIAAGALGHHESGPLIVLARVRPGARPLSSCTFDTEVFRLVARGSHVLDGRTYETGDMRVQASGTRFGPAAAGREGVDEIVVIADRRAIVPGAVDDAGWARALDGALADISTRGGRVSVG